MIFVRKSNIKKLLRKDHLQGFSDEISEDIFQYNNVWKLSRCSLHFFYHNLSFHHHEEFVVTNPGEDQFLIE